MMEELPFYISLIFILTTLLTVFLFYQSAHYSSRILVIALSWLLLQAMVGLSEFYTQNDTFPPRMIGAIGPPFLLIALLLLTAKGKAFSRQLDLKTLTYLHVVRIPVEIVLYLLYQYALIPELMTFEGRNIDILAGISAPLAAYAGFRHPVVNRKLLLAWNIIGLGLVLNIAFHGILSVQSNFQQFAFDQPNVALTYFPFLWLPCFIVPVVIYAHLTSIVRLWPQPTLA